MLAINLLAGVVLLWIGGEAFVRGSVAVGTHLRVSQLMIGLTLVGFGTSLPELVTSVTAALAGSPGLAVGNVVGSNITNVLLILGIAALIRPVVCQPAAFYRDAAALALASLLGVGFILTGQLGYAKGLVLLAGLAIYIGRVYQQERRQSGPALEVFVGEAQIETSPGITLPLAALLVLCGMGATAGGAWLLVAAAVDLATLLGVSKTFIGLTIVAAGTSLPELVITAVASFRGRSDVALGNIMGSNMFNILGILGVTAIVKPFAIPSELRLFDLLAMLAATGLLILGAATRMRISRRDGTILLACYVGYIAIRAGIASGA